jgi:hypothetical protein
MGPQRRDTKTRARLSVLIRESTSKNSGFDPSFGVLSRSDLRLAIIRTLSDGRDVTQLGREVFSGTSISQGAQYLGDGHGQFALSGGPRIAYEEDLLNRS